MSNDSIGDEERLMSVGVVLAERGMASAQVMLTMIGQSSGGDRGIAKTLLQKMQSKNMPPEAKHFAPQLTRMIGGEPSPGEWLVIRKAMLAHLERVAAGPAMEGN